MFTYGVSLYRVLLALAVDFVVVVVDVIRKQALKNDRKMNQTRWWYFTQWQFIGVQWSWDRCPHFLLMCPLLQHACASFVDTLTQLLKNLNLQFYKAFLVAQQLYISIRFCLDFFLDFFVCLWKSGLNQTKQNWLN